MSANTFAERPRAEQSPTLPAELDAAGSKLVYLYLAASDGATVEELQGNLDMRKLSLFPVLSDLTDRGIVQQDGATYRPA